MNDLDLRLEVVQGHVNYCGVNSPKILELKTSNLVHHFLCRMPSWRQNWSHGRIAKSLCFQSS